MDRRELLGLGAAAALTMLGPAWAQAVASAPPARGGEGMLAVADARYSDSLRFARGLRRAGATLLPLAPDLSRLWFDGIGPRRQAGFRDLAGLTLSTDLFVLERLAETSGARTRYVGCHDWRRGPGSAHRLSGAIELGGMAGALGGGEAVWAARLGEALAGAAGQHRGRAEINLALDGAAAADSPRYFVSWLMSWQA